MRTGIITACLFIAGYVFAQEQIDYKISFPNAVHHEAEISIAFAELPAGPLQIRMSRSSPGRYALHEFGKNVYRVRATDSRGRPLKIDRPDPYMWTVAGHNGFVRFSYTLFADRAGGTYAGIDRSHAHLNMPATFMWARGLGERPISIRFNPPEGSGWKVATQLAPTNDPLLFTAENLAYFLDSPTELSAFTLREHVFESGGRSQTIRLALHHEGTEAEADAYAEMAWRVVAEQEGIFGELPSFDYGTYTFIADYLPWVSGDGMEHRNSTILTSTRPLKTRAVANLGTVSHEFIHAWNVERIRPRSLEPFDFERANMSGELWFAEGFTSYYTGLTLTRAGLQHLDRYARNLSGTLDYVINSPGHQFFSPVEMSMQAPFVDAASSIDPTNRVNTFISYYSYGSVTGLGLDLLLRTRFPNVTLDDLMREMWESYGKNEKPYTNIDIQEALAKVTGDAAFAKRFFDQHVFGSEIIDYAPLLERAGLRLRLRNPGKPWLDDTGLRVREGELALQGGTKIGSPLYKAGLDRGDVLIELDSKPVNSRETYDEILGALKPGAAVSVRYRQRGQEIDSSLVVAEDPHLEVVPFEHLGIPLISEITRFREAWLGSKARVRMPALSKYCPTCKRAFGFKWENCTFDGEPLAITPQ